MSCRGYVKATTIEPSLRDGTDGTFWSESTVRETFATRRSYEPDSARSSSIANRKPSLTGQRLRGGRKPEKWLSRIAQVRFATATSRELLAALSRSAERICVRPEVVQEARSACRELRLIGRSKRRDRRPTSSELERLRLGCYSGDSRYSRINLAQVMHERHQRLWTRVCCDYSLTIGNGVSGCVRNLSRVNCTRRQ
jgi:hypothetical protein